MFFQATTFAGGRWALVRAVLIRACWEGPFGAVKEDDRPSWLIAAPRMIACPAGSVAWLSIVL